MSRHLPLEDLKMLLGRAESEVPVRSVWRHYRDNRGEKPYTVVGHVINEHDDSVGVLYTNDQQVVFNRPLAEFTEAVRGGTQKRFQKIS